MHLFFKLPDNFHTLSTPDKITFIKSCYAKRLDMYQKVEGRLFSQTTGFYKHFLQTIANYFTPSITQHLYTSINHHDLEMAIAILNLGMLSNQEFCQQVSTLCRDNINLSSQFKSMVTTSISELEANWREYTRSHSFDDNTSAKFRYGIKSAASASLLLTLFSGLSLFNLFIIATAIVSYSASGELGDALASLKGDNESLLNSASKFLKKS